MSSIADMFVNIGADIGDFKKQMNDMKDLMKDTGEKLKDVGGGMSKYVTAPLAAVGAAAFASALDVDNAQKNIRAGTGATGKALEELTDNFKNVFANFPGDAATVSSALADINTRTGLIGKPLEDLTKQFLELSKITSEDVNTSIANMTRLFGAWGIEAENGGDAMDYLWKTSQTFGIGVGELQGKLVEMGPTFQALGYSMEESAALLGHWEREGVNTSTMLAGLKKGLINIADAGEEPAVMLPKLIDQIKGAGTESEATALAMEFFGNKAGPEMAAAIRSGKFEVEELLAILDSSDETIGKAAAETMSLGEQFTMLKNNVVLALEPIGKMLLDLAQQFLPPLIEKVQQLAAWFQNLSPEIQTAIVVVAAIVAAIGPLLVVLGTAISALSALAPLFTLVKVVILALTGPIGLVVAAVAGLIAIGVLLYKNWDVITQKAGELKKLVVDKVKGMAEDIKQTFNNIINYITGLGSSFFNAGKGLIEQMINGIKAMASKVIDTVKGIAGKVRDLLPFSPAKDGPLSDLDKLDFGGPIADSIARALPQVQNMMADLLNLPTITASFAGVEDESAGFVGGGDSYGDIYVTIPVDDLEQINDINEFFNDLRQTKRARG